MTEFVMHDDQVKVFLDQFKFSCKANNIDFGVVRGMPDFTTFCQEFRKFKPGLKNANFSAAGFNDFADDDIDEYFFSKIDPNSPGSIIQSLASGGAAVGSPAYMYQAYLSMFEPFSNGKPGDPAMFNIETVVAVSPLVRGLVLENGDTSRGITPPTAPTAALISPPAAGNVDDGTHSYKITFVVSGTETEGGSASNIVTVADKTVNGKVHLTNIPIGPAGTTSRKVYRTVAGNAAPWKLVATIADNTTTTYDDNTDDASLGASIPTTSTGGNFNGTTVDFGTPPVGEDLYGTLHVISGSGGTLTVTVQSDDNSGMTTPATVFAFTGVTGPGKQMFGPVSSNLQRYYRIIATITGGGGWHLFSSVGYSAG